MIFSTFNVVVIEPYVARLNRKHLLPMFCGSILLVSVICMPIVWIAFRFPLVFLWLIGPRYRELANLVGWVVLTACMNHIISMIWIMNRARKWVFWTGSMIEVSLILATEVIFVTVVGITNTRNAVMLGFACSFCYLAAHGYTAIYGFLYGPRMPGTAHASI